MSEGSQIVRASDEQIADAPLPAAVGMARRRDPRPLPSPHSHKFRTATAILISLAAAALVVAIAILANGTTPSSSFPWSSWAPDDHGALGAREIADHVAPLYRISPVDQLAVVTVANLSSSAGTTSSTGSSGPGAGSASTGLQVAVRPDAASSGVSVLSGKTVAYNLCGIGGPDCAIGVGQPSSDRLLLLRREALELALYTFKYISGVKYVVATLPPGHTTTTGRLSAKPPAASAAVKPLDVALLFAHGELGPFLSDPLSATLPEQVPPTVAQVRAAPESGLVEQITARGLFSENLERAQDGSSLIVLTPLPPQ